MLVGAASSSFPDRASWSEWFWFARVERVTPLLYELVDTVPTDLTDEQRGEVYQHQGVVMTRCVQLEHHMLALATGLRARGIRVVVLKGGATSHVDYPDPSLREFSDIDLLVDPGDREAAIAIVEESGWRRGYALPRGHDEFTHAVTYVRDQMELDLHQRLGHRALGLLVPPAEVLVRAVPFEVAGIEVWALDTTDRLIHACLHSVSARPADRRLSSVVDVLLLADRHAHLADEVVERAEHWRVRSLVEHAVRDAFATAQLVLPNAWTIATRRPLRRRDRLVDWAYLRPVRRPWVEELAYLRLLGGWRSRSRYAGGYFAPSADYAEQHGRGSVFAQARYVLSKLRAR